MGAYGVEGGGMVTMDLVDQPALSLDLPVAGECLKGPGDGVDGARPSSLEVRGRSARRRQWEVVVGGCNRVVELSRTPGRWRFGSSRLHDVFGEVALLDKVLDLISQCSAPRSCVALAAVEAAVELR
jgi:hypothetical protein